MMSIDQNRFSIDKVLIKKLFMKSFDSYMVRTVYYI